MLSTPKYSSIRKLPANTVLGNNTGAEGYAQALSAIALRAFLGLGTAAYAATGDFDVAGAATTAVASHVFASDPHGDRAYAASLVSGLSAVYQPLDGDLTSIAGLNTTSYGRSVLTQADAAALRTLAGLGTVATLDVDTDTALTANSDTKVPSQKAVKSYVDAAVTGLLDFKGNTNCSANPNYPAASKGDFYIVSVAGKIGGASGTSVDVGDVYVASADNAGGTQASVGISWFVLEHNLQGALLAANNLSDVASASTARTNLGLAIGSNVQAWDGDLDALAALAGTNTIYYRSGANTWTAVTIGTGLSFSGGSLACTVTGGSPGGSSGQVQYYDGVSFAGAAGLVYSTSSPNFLVTSQGTTHIIQRWKGVASQSGDVWQHLDNSNNVIAKLAALGKLTLGNQSVDGTAGVIQLEYKSGSNAWNHTISQSITTLNIFSNGTAVASIDPATSFIQGPLRSQGMCIGNTFGNRSTYYVPPTSGLRVEGQAVFGINTDIAGSQVRVVPGAVGTIGQVIHGFSASQTGNLQEWQKSDGTIYTTISENGYFTTRKNSAVADAELAAGEMALWFDSTNGAGKLMVKAKTADGTVVTGSLTLA